MNCLNHCIDSRGFEGTQASGGRQFHHGQPKIFDGAHHRDEFAHIHGLVDEAIGVQIIRLDNVAFLIGGLQNAGNSLQGPDFPSGLVGVIQGIILFSALGGELLVRYRIRVSRRQRTDAAPAPEAT